VGATDRALRGCARLAPVVTNRTRAMKVVAVINAKGGCGKSTIATGLAAGLARKGLRTLLIDMDPQAQVTQWLGAGDGLTAAGTLVAAFSGVSTLGEVIQSTAFENLSFVPSAEVLEEVGRRITEFEDYPTILAHLLVAIKRLTRCPPTD